VPDNKVEMPDKVGSMKQNVVRAVASICFFLTRLKTLEKAKENQ